MREEHNVGLLMLSQYKGNLSDSGITYAMWIHEMATSAVALLISGLLGTRWRALISFLHIFRHGTKATRAYGHIGWGGGKWTNRIHVSHLRLTPICPSLWLILSYDIRSKTGQWWEEIISHSWFRAWRSRLPDTPRYFKIRYFGCL